MQHPLSCSSSPSPQNWGGRGRELGGKPGAGVLGFGWPEVRAAPRLPTADCPLPAAVSCLQPGGRGLGLFERVGAVSTGLEPTSPATKVAGSPYQAGLSGLLLGILAGRIGRRAQAALQSVPEPAQAGFVRQARGFNRRAIPRMAGQPNGDCDR